ncbi:unnamed protein product [Prorocentrum cordatum]|uniref:EF-hand domain-containing protein n=1 Tax=Prorocentrum cordatum TaxID=2364126 RepID=A0ABN9Q793_9DINO|nr:unnamed protein product [Polarella glacialis]
MVSIVKRSEDELMAKVTLRGKLHDIMDVYDSDGNGKLKQSEFDLFIRNVEVMQALHHFDVDIKGLMTLCEMLFSHVSPDGQTEEVALSFDEIMNLAVRLKGTSACRVEDDIVKLREFTKYRLEMLEEHLIYNQRTILLDAVRARRARWRAGLPGRPPERPLRLARRPWGGGAAEPPRLPRLSGKPPHPTPARWPKDAPTGEWASRSSTSSSLLLVLPRPSSPSSPILLVTGLIFIFRASGPARGGLKMSCRPPPPVPHAGLLG